MAADTRNIASLTRCTDISVMQSLAEHPQLCSTGFLAGSE